MKGIVFGASGTLGQAIIKKALALGHSVCGVLHYSKNDPTLEKDALYIEDCDIKLYEDIERAMKKSKEIMGVPDYVINCAAVTFSKPFMEMTFEEWKKVYDINFLASFSISHIFSRMLAKEKTPGSIIMLSSGYAERHVPELSAYSTSKAGVTSLCKVLSVELAAYNIRINSITPGLFPSKMTELFVGNKNYINQLMKHIPDMQLGSAADIADIALFLVSPSCKHINGANIVIDGGMVNLFEGGIVR